MPRGTLSCTCLLPKPCPRGNFHECESCHVLFTSTVGQTNTGDTVDVQFVAIESSVKADFRDRSKDSSGQ